MVRVVVGSNPNARRPPVGTLEQDLHKPTTYSTLFKPRPPTPDKLKRVDVTANDISSIDEAAFSSLPALEELVIRENRVSQLPALPATMTLIDASHNNVGSRGLHKEAFKVHCAVYIYTRPTSQSALHKNTWVLFTESGSKRSNWLGLRVAFDLAHVFPLFPI